VNFGKFIQTKSDPLSFRDRSNIVDLELTGETAVVTGAASGIGLACAKRFAESGCRVALWDVATKVNEEAESLERIYQVPCVGLNVDVGNYDSVLQAVRTTEAKLGNLAHLVHAAAVSSGRFGFPFTNLQPADWKKVLDINVLGMVHVAHAVSPGLIERRYGTMAFIGSVAGQIGSQTDPPYSASKAANINFAQCLAKDLARHHVRVNVVNPGMVQTPLNRQVWQAWNDQQLPENRRTYDDWASEKVRNVVPLGRWQKPEDIADMVVFLASRRAAQVTAQSINVDGGQVIRW